MECRIATVRDFKHADRAICAVALCRPGSEMQGEFSAGTSLTPIAIVYDGVHPVAWTASHVWQGLQTLEGFTRESHRRRGLQRFAASGLISAGVLDTAKPVAIFRACCFGLTRSLGFGETRLFQRMDTEWIEVPT